MGCSYRVRSLTETGTLDMTRGRSKLQRTPHEACLTELIQLLSSFERTRVLVVGDAMLDEYVDGPVHRVSPEAPVPVVSVRTRHHVAGGAAHVARVVAALGAEVELISITGDDEDGEILRSACQASGVKADRIVAVTGRPTTKKTRIVSGAQQIVRIDKEDATPMPQSARDAVQRALASAQQADTVIVSDYAKGLLDDRTLASVMELGHRWGALVLVDPKDVDLSRYRGADVVKLNRDELGAAVGRAPIDQSDRHQPDIDLHALEQRAATIRRACEASAVVVTLGADGMATFAEDADTHWVPASGQEVFDVTGAGDVVAAVLALALTNGMQLPAAATYSNLAAGVSVRRRGAHGVDPSQLLEELVHRSLAGSTSRHPIERSELVALVQAWRRSGQSIAFTNGCFDLFHRGHLQLLRQAAELGDRLVVAVDTDASVRGLKGPDRPVIGQSDRADIVGALPFVDAVVLFDSGLEALIADVRPDVLVKGADYLDRDVVGRDLVESSGGRVELIPLLERRSTSAIVGRLRPSGSSTESDT